MEVLFVSGFGPIVTDYRRSLELYRDSLGLALEPVPGQADYFHSDRIDGAKHFALWPLRAVAQSCFGAAEWPDTHPVPQSWIEFEVRDIAVATRKLKADGWTLLVEAKQEPWGQTVTRLLSPENVLVSVTITPWMRNDL